MRWIGLKFARWREVAALETQVTLKLLWINSGTPELPEVSRSEFARRCNLCEIDATDPCLFEMSADWDLACFNFDYPDMEGLKLLRRVKERWPSVPVVMLTLQKSADIALWALRSRVFDLLIKPVSGDEVERVLTRIATATQARSRQSERRAYPVTSELPSETRYRPHAGTQQRLQVAVAQIEKHYGRHIPESEVATMCQMSPSRFCHEFKAAFGATFVDYLAHYRVGEAKRLIANPRMSLADVAATVGFTDPSYFARVFRKHEGLTPSEYRLAHVCADAHAVVENPSDLASAEVVTFQRLAGVGGPNAGTDAHPIVQTADER